MQKQIRRPQIHRPPHKMYAFEGGWQLTKEGAEALIAWANTNSTWWLGNTNRITAQAEHQNILVKILAFIVVLVLFLLDGVQYALAFLTMSIFVSIRVLVLLVMMGGTLPMIGVLVACSWLYARVHHIDAHCPMPYCFAEMPVPTFTCSNPMCRTPHSRLWPNTYGVFFHRCQCGKRLPTLDRFGRKDLNCFCPACERPLAAEIGRTTNIEIPIIGGPSAGKTNYIVMATKELKRVYEDVPHQYSLSFVEDAHKRLFNTRIRQLEAGEKLAKTQDAETVPEAYLLKIKVPRVQVEKLVFIYDAAGEAFRTDEKISYQTYYKYSKGMILVIDPCAISAYRRTHQYEIDDIRRSLAPSELDVEEICNRMLRVFEVYREEFASQKHKLPVAVVVTKVDALGLEQEIGLPAAQSLIASSSSSITQEEAIDAVVQVFLRKYNLGNLVDQLAINFAEVRYFSCSALGRLPSDADKRGFVPIRVLEPIAWLLKQNKVIESK